MITTRAANRAVHGGRPWLSWVKTAHGPSKNGRVVTQNVGQTARVPVNTAVHGREVPIARDDNKTEQKMQ